MTGLQIWMTGIDHSVAGVEIRERFSLTSREKSELMEMVSALPGTEGCVLLHTCNRTELWVSTNDGAAPDLTGILCSFKELDGERYRSFFREKADTEAITYLFELASGLHSMIIGEDQILAQVKKALSEAREAGCCGSVLDVLFRSAVTGAKRVKTELTISTANASAVDFAIRRMQAKGLDFTGKNCLVIGNGEMGKRAAMALVGLGAQVTVTIRQYTSGIVQVVPGCERINYGDRYSLIPHCAVVVSATSSPNMTLTRDQVEACGAAPGTVFIDLAVPRDIDPEIAGIPGMTLLDIDSFSVSQTDELKAQLSAARELLEEQQKKFMAWFQGRDLLPAVEASGEKFAGEVLFRMGAALKKLDASPEQKKVLQEAVLDAARKEWKKALFAVRDEVGAEVLRRCLAAMEEDHG